MKRIQLYFIATVILATLCLPGCQTGNAPVETINRNLAPQRVDIRGSVIRSHYSDGQVVLEVEALAPSPDSRYNRAYVLVMPTAQMLGPEGQLISISELHMGQNVAILLRGGGKGNFVGVGIARKLWVEDTF